MLAAMHEALSWYRRRTFHHAAFPAARLAAERRESVSVCLPARNEAATIGPILQALLPLRDAGVVDEVVVVDDSTDGTGEIAAGLGADVHDQSSLRPEFGPVLGKGDALWRSLAVLRGDVVCFLDADSREAGDHFALGLVGPLLTDPSLAFVKGFYRRPLDMGGEAIPLPEGGGRVTELTARPLLNRFFPELAGFVQPLAGEIAARRDLLERLPFATGYAVEIVMLIDAWRAAGLDALAQVDLDVRQNRHQPLGALGPMAAAVLAGVVSRIESGGRFARAGASTFLAPSPSGGLLERDVQIVERPPARTLANVR
jgi:glucosyl-3-phosphoglycerate synthase